MTSPKTSQTMKPETAAKKLGILAEAAPAAFRDGVVSRDELNALQADPPEWLRELRRTGPHPRAVSAAKLGVSIGGLARGGITEPLDSEQIEALKANPPQWLQHERETQAEFRRETARVKEKLQQAETPATPATRRPASSQPTQQRTQQRTQTRRSRP